MTVALARVLAALHLEHNHLVALHERVDNFTHYFCSLYGRSTYRHCTVSIYEQHLVKFNSLAFLGILDVVNEELLALFYLKLLTLNVYNCVHLFIVLKGFLREAAYVRTHFTLPQRTQIGVQRYEFSLNFKLLAFSFVITFRNI